jgi:signal transduction histidine kinase
MSLAYARLRGHPLLLDKVLVVVLFALSADQWPDRSPFPTMAVSALLALTVAARRYPLGAFMAAGAIATAQIIGGLNPANEGSPIRALEPTATDVVIPVLLYTVASRCSRRVSVACLVACLAGSAVVIARWAPLQVAYPQGLLLAAGAGLGGTALAAWVLGDSVAVRRRREAYAALEERTVRAEAERDAQARIAAAARRAHELEDRRARAIDTSAARLRRIERDLHDGAQVRLAALAMTLGEIKEYLESGEPDGAARARTLAGAAHDNAKETLAELRDLARGIHPAVLDRGLATALSSLAETSAVPVLVRSDDAGEPSPAIAAIAYFCAAELLANAAKHSCASQIRIVTGDRAGRFAMTVTDDGAGGARVAPGGGLAGLRERAQTVDGSLDVSSPPGGPTVVTVELPRSA